MGEFTDFRVILTRNIEAPGIWDVLLEDCPVPLLAGPKGKIQPNITTQQLIRLRSRHGWPNLDELRTIGKEVWHSLMTPTLEAAFTACLAQSEASNRGMRLVVSMVGEEPESAQPGIVRLQELPLEALYFDQLNFVAPNPSTPVSRSLKFKPDREPQRLAFPVRILVVVATPTDRPAANMQEEKDAIQNALKKLIDVGVVELEFCDPPTRLSLMERLQERFHILHFIGHGAFDIEGDDPSPRPHLCLENASRESDAVDAKTLEIMLQNSGVRLVVLTACASAAPSPDEVQQTIGPFEGVAQTLMAGVSGINAAVAMQFDLESNAAVTFSRTFYTRLLTPGSKLDEVVALCRKELVNQMNAGHRAWVTPVVYWRCRDGKVFDVDPLTQKRDEQTERELLRIDTTLGVYLANIAKARNLPEAIRQAVAALVDEWQQEVDNLLQQRGRLLGETLRLRGGAVKPADSLTCRLTFRLRSAARIGDVTARILYPADKVSYVSAAAGSNAASIPFIQTPVPGEIRLLSQNASQGIQWTPDEYELAMLTFRVQADINDPFLELKIEDGQVQRDGATSACEAQNAVLFVS